MEQTKPKNNLPKNWAVKNDGSQLFKDTVIKYINDTYIPNTGYHRKLTGEDLNWYGYDGHPDSFYGCNNKNNLSDFRAAVEPLSIKEFIELSKPIEGIDNNVKFEDLGPAPIDEDNNEIQKWEPKYGDIVWAWDIDRERKLKMIFLANIPNSYIVQVPEDYIANKDCNITKYIHICQYIEPKEYTIQEVAKALGEEVGNFTIKQ